MKAGEVLKSLKISRPTLHKYMKEGLIKAVRLPTGQYNYSKVQKIKQILEASD